MKTDIFHLQIIPLSWIVPHEDFDERRTLPLVSRLKKEGFLSNPILVAPLEEKKYLQLDGMNRLSAFRKMGLETILVQIIDYNDQATVELSSWVHLVEKKLKDFLEFIEKKVSCQVKGGTLENVGYRYIKEEGWGRLCTIVGKDKSVYLVRVNGAFPEKIKKLNKIVSFYKKRIIRDVLPQGGVNGGNLRHLFAAHTEAELMVVFPIFTRHQIIETVKKGLLLPAGVTRHIIKRRCLNLNFPLSFFAKKESLAEKNKELEKMLLRRPFRVYEEPTIYFE